MSWKKIKEAFFKDDTGELNLLTVMITALMLMFTFLFIKAEILEKPISETMAASIVQLISIAFGGVSVIGGIRKGVDYVNRNRSEDKTEPHTPEVKEKAVEVVKRPIQITKNFKLSEFDCNDGTPVPNELIPNAQELANNLQVLSDELGNPRIIVTSGYRTDDYNAKVGGKPSSFHKKAMAGDIDVEGYTPEQVAEKIEFLIATGKMKQGGIGVYTKKNKFVHYDIRGVRARWDG